MTKEIPETILQCPLCKNIKLEIAKEKITCTSCNATYNKTNNKISFISSNESEITDHMDKIKSIFKKYPRLYLLLIKVVSPVYATGFIKSYLEKNLNKGQIILNLGSGNTSLSDEIINMDMVSYHNVNITADITDVPIRDESVHSVLNLGVLEHLPNPEVVVKEMYRILKKGGTALCFMPFMMGFHASPHDYTRFTQEGLKHLFKDFEDVKVTVAAGPTTSLLWILQEWLAILFSFGSIRLHTFLYIFFMLISFPIKYLDILLIRHPMSKNIAGGFSIEIKK